MKLLVKMDADTYILYVKHLLFLFDFNLKIYVALKFSLKFETIKLD